METKIFFSYSQENPTHVAKVREWADALINEGINVLIDQYELEPGDDLIYYMERIVADPSVSHSLVFCDKSYMNKANSRQRGVGIEAQLITSEIYSHTEKSKFVPIVCEFENGTPCLPVFMRNRYWIDFSTSDKVRANWKKLLQHLYGIPQTIQVLDENLPNGSLQVSKLSTGFRRIASSLTVRQLYRVLKYLKSEESGKREFDSFIINNSSRNKYWELNSRGERTGRTEALYVFELYSLLIEIFAEMCGYNLQHILFDKQRPLYPSPINPAFIEVTKDAYEQIVEQLTGLIRHIDKDITIVGDSFTFMNQMPRILDPGSAITEFAPPPSKRFAPSSPYVLDRKTSRKYYAREVFHIDSGEFESSRLSKKEKVQAYFDLGSKVCEAVLQEAFDLTEKPYNARYVLEAFFNSFINEDSPFFEGTEP